MSQIKRKFAQPNYGLSALAADLKLLWNNARTYNTEGSWVYNAADEMEAYFDKRYAEESANISSGNGNGDSTEGTTPVPSGQSTPMYKGPTLGTKIKLNLGASSRRNEVVDSEPEASGGDEDEDDDDDDDDY